MDTSASRKIKEKLTISCCYLALATSALFLLAIISDAFNKGIGSFAQHVISVDYHFSELTLKPKNGKYLGCERNLKKNLKTIFPSLSAQRADRKKLAKIFNYATASKTCDYLQDNPDWLGTTQKINLHLSGSADLFLKRHSAEDAHLFQFDNFELSLFNYLKTDFALRTVFNWGFLLNADSRYPALAGIGGALAGSLLCLVVVLLLALPIGVAAGIYIEEISEDGPVKRIIDTTTNNLAAIPSIIYGLLGLGLFINFFTLPRSTPLVGGLVLTLMTLPTIIIATKASLQQVPGTIKQAAKALGATDMQTILHHTLPGAMPGIITGTIIGLAGALGETAPLLMIGMVAFIIEVPDSFVANASALPVQVFLWADNPERPFVERTGAAIIVLISLLAVLNATAIYLRHRLKIKW